VTEYESAILALEIAQGVREQVVLVQTQAELVSSGGSTSFAFISGYIIVAHYVASQLSRAQVVLLNFLYVFAMTFSGLAMFTSHSVGVIHYVKLLEIDPSRTAIPYWSSGSTLIFITFLFLCTFASIVFFYSSRRSAPNDAAR
jgi:hypothetical protein